MLNSGKEFRDKKENILTLVFSEEKLLNETKNHTHSCHEYSKNCLLDITIQAS
jgi:hypothetical protein